MPTGPAFGRPVITSRYPPRPCVAMSACPHDRLSSQLHCRGQLLLHRQCCEMKFRIQSKLRGSFRSRPCAKKTNARILAAHNQGCGSKHCRAGCPNCLGLAICSSPCNRNTYCRDFPLPWSHNRCSGCSGLGWRWRAWLMRAHLPRQERRQRREFCVSSCVPSFGCCYPRERKGTS
jgi:hypothetical protein